MRRDARWIFSNTVICMTSNAGSSDQSAGSLGFNKSDAQRSEEKRPARHWRSSCARSSLAAWMK